MTASSRTLPDLYEAAIAERVIPRRRKVDGPRCSHKHFSTLEFTGLQNAGCLYRTDRKSEDRVYSGDLWEIIGERSIEVMQEEMLRRHQYICTGGDSGRHALVEQVLMDERKKRCQMEVSLYSQAIELLEQHWMSCSIATQETFKAWLTRNNAHHLVPCSEPLIEKNLHSDGSTLSVFGQSASQAGRPTSISLNCIGSSFSLSSTWVTSNVQEKTFMAFQAELAMQAGLMVTSLATRRNNARLRNLGLDLLILRAKLCRAQAEMELYTMAIENSHVCGFCDGSLSTSPDLIVPRHLPKEVDLIHDEDDDEDDDSNGTGSKDYDDINVW
ncbi:uncharacterized protein EDB91DRAFT_1084757 [Suillus paluster]|uniref:uncharacterized protein n=1 Tax=Suillus paluster TaxID=48578 RepID=UPI001B85D38D|nr:uncharacterized protein EDB91DRAFT_1084757 [Suillus paluster]KAG1732428.1 hypothetical protein EDB91DRAFT_1084757 [Suillus paluster]